MKLDCEKGVVHHFLLDCQVRQFSKHTMVSYRHHLGVVVSLLGKLCNVSDLEQVTVVHLRQCVQHLMTNAIERPKGGHPLENGSTLSIASIRGYVRVWKAFFNWCYQEELIEKNPVDRLSLPKPTKHVKPTFTPEHIERMLASCDLSTDMGFRDYVILLLLLDTGIRLAEISSLRVADVHDTYIKVFGKGRKEREVGLHPEVAKLLWKYIHKHRHPTDPNEAALFIGYFRGSGKPLGYEGVKELLSRIQADCGLQDIQLSPHVFRHTFAKMYLEQGGDLFKLSREMGHSDVQITKLYLEDFTSTEARRDHPSFSPIGRIHLRKQQKKRKKTQE